VHISKLLQQRIKDLHRQGMISGEEWLLVNAEMQSLLDITGACERIKNTPIPYSYSAFIKKFIAVYVLTLPFGFAFTLGYIAIPVVMFIFYVLASLELIAEEIEDPFGTDTNDLPMEKMAETIRKNVQECLGN
jgi:putative membrane protein